MTNEIGGYADWPRFVRERPLLGGDDWANRAAVLLGVPEPLRPPEPRVVGSWSVVAGGVRVRTTELAWQVGFGPDLHAYLLHPDGTDPAVLPGLLALHSHGGIKSVGAARMISPPADRTATDDSAAGAHFATRAAARGWTVLAPDAFSWGSRRFVFDPVPDKLAPYADLLERAGEPAATRYDSLAAIHEHLLAKFAGVLGTSFAGMVAHDDLSALAVLRGLCDGPLAVAGFSGGGGRAISVSALAGVERVAVVAMMATFDSLIPDHVATHSWLLNTPGLARAVELPVLAANRTDQRLLVVYGERDPLFPLAGMQAAHRELTRLFQGASGSYRGLFLDAGHEFEPPAQDRVLDFLVG